MRSRQRRPLLLSFLSLALLLPVLSVLPAPAAVAQPVPDARILVFSKTAGFRHDSIPNGIAAIQQLGAANGFAVDATEDAGAFTEANLAQYDAVVFLSTTGDVLDAAQQAAFEGYIQGGGGFVGIHAAADTEYDWPWYGGLVGAYFESHPPGTPQGQIAVADRAHPSTAHLPKRWVRTDEWYNFQTNPRGDVHVLATLDERSYAGGTDGFDHPTAWCHDYDGGRAWYTGGGHTGASFAEPAFVQHLLGGIRTAAGLAQADCGATIEGNFQKTPLDLNTANPFELDVAPDGRVFFIERGGDLKIWKPDTRATVTAGHVDVFTGVEDGLMGLALDPDFATNQWVYLYYAPVGAVPLNRLARFTMDGDQLLVDSIRVLLDVPTQRVECCHSAGSLAFDSQGNLYLSTGDNTNPFASNGFAPIDERPGRSPWDAQKSSSNTNDLRGKILRVTPQPDGTIAIPEGNLFPAGTPQARPEIYTMGHRNPFRISVDPETDWLYWGEVGPDAGDAVSGRGPAGYDEFNQARAAGNYGWPYCIADNKPYNDFTFPTGPSGQPFDCAGGPVNNSPNNTGLTTALPPARPAWAWYPYAPSAEFPELETGGRTAMAGPVYHFDPDNPSETKLPAYYDDTLFVYEWSRNWIKEVKLDDQGNILKINPFLPTTTFTRPMDLELGPDGALYLLEWGSAFGGGNDDSGLYKIEYVGGARAPIASATADPTSGPAPLTVQFDGSGSRDPDPGDTLTFAWDFTSDGTVDSTAVSPSFTYTANGNYTARLTVTDSDGRTGVADVPITVGNTAPTVTVEAPVDGGFFEFGDEIAYRVTVTDPEDGTVDCDDVELRFALGHDTHDHTLQNLTGCEGTIQTVGGAGHDDNANLYGIFEASYTDGGAPGGIDALTSSDRAVLQPKHKQAEHYAEQSGVQLETTGDVAGGGQNVAFIDDGDWVAYEPVSLQDIHTLSFRVASAGLGGTIQVRLDAPDGPLVTSAAVPVTGGWQTYVTVDAPVPPTAGTHRLFLVFAKPAGAGAGSLFNVNFFDARGKGVTVNQRPDVVFTATPPQGQAPLTVEFDGSATDPEGDTPIAYAWNFGVPGAPEPTTEDATFTFADPGTYTVTLTATDSRGAARSVSSPVRVTQQPDPDPGCAVRSDEFGGNALDRTRWSTVIREDQAGLNVDGGSLNITAALGDIYQAGTDAKNLVLQPVPSAASPWTATAKVTLAATEAYHQAGLMVYGDDDNYAKVNLVSTGGGNRKFELIYETAGSPRNEAPDSTPNLPAGFPDTYYVRLMFDGTTLTGAWSEDGVTFSPVGRPAPFATIPTPRVGPFALGGAGGATTTPVASFDWVRLEPDGAGTPVGPSDEFDGGALDTCRWSAIVRKNPAGYRVNGGQLHVDTHEGDIFATPNTDPQNLILQPPLETDDWTLETKLTAPLVDSFQQGGLLVYVDDDNYLKFDLVADNAPGAALARRFELRAEVGGVIQDPQPGAGIPASAGTTWHLRLTKRGSTFTGEFSADGQAWTALSQSVTHNGLDDADVGLLAIGPAQDGDPITVSFDWFRVATDQAAPVTTAVTEPAEPGATGWFTSPVRVTLSATDPAGGSGVATTEFKLGEADWAPYTGPITIGDDGVTVLSYRSTDRAGNVEEAKTLTIRLDTAAPAVTTGGLVHGTLYGDSQDVRVTFAATDATSGVDEVSGSIGGAPILTGTLKAMYELPLGLHELRVVATDEAGNRTEEVVTFFVTTSFRDIANLIDRFRATGRLTQANARQLADQLARARRAEANGNDTRAIRELEAFMILVDTPGLVREAEIRDVLLRDAAAMIERLGGQPGAAGVRANRGRPLDGTGRLAGDPTRVDPTTGLGSLSTPGALRRW